MNGRVYYDMAFYVLHIQISLYIKVYLYFIVLRDYYNLMVHLQYIDTDEWTARKLEGQ